MSFFNLRPPPRFNKCLSNVTSVSVLQLPPISPRYELDVLRFCINGKIIGHTQRNRVPRAPTLAGNTDSLSSTGGSRACTPIVSNTQNGTATNGVDCSGGYWHRHLDAGKLLRFIQHRCGSCSISCSPFPRHTLRNTLGEWILSREAIKGELVSINN